ncbi:MAG: hypothetical protein ABIQ70_05580, partial [Dokdonella sp.]
KLDFAGQYTMQPPRYDSKDNTDRPADQKFGTPEDAARPGEKFFFTAVHSLREKDYVFTVDMYLVSASWGYKPAQYNLGVMYLRGEGIPVDRPRAMAWMALASERGDPQYVQARELLYADLSKEEFARANEIWRQIKATYADEVAFARAKARWAQTRAAMTGSRVGGAGPLTIGSANAGGRMSAMVSPLIPEQPRSSGGKNSVPYADNKGKSIVNGFATAAFGVLGGGGEDGSKAYRHLRETDNPYDPRFSWHPSSGEATVGPLIPVGDAQPDEQPRDR